MAHLKYFPEEFIQLQIEVQHFPDLMERLLAHKDVDPELQFVKMLSEICAYLGIVMDGTFDEAEFIGFAGQAVDMLRKKRSAIWTLPEGITMSKTIN